MSLKEFTAAVDKFSLDYGQDNAAAETALDGLSVLRCPVRTQFEATLYHPVVCLILQGRKETVLGNRSISFGAGESLIVSHDLPVVSRITEASAAVPYLAVVQRLDLGIARGLYDEIGDAVLDDERAVSMDVGDTEAALVDALERYFCLLNRPIEARVMAPMILREIHFRLLLAPHGAMLRRMLHRDSHASRVSRAIDRIRQGFRKPLAVADLAETAGMSPSSFHEHFKSITATTPLQYQKDLRLIEARRLIAEGTHSVSGAAYDVGYESPTQFSREYARKFGAPPKNDRPKVAASG